MWGPGSKQPGLNSKTCQEPARSNPWETQALQISLKPRYSALMSHAKFGVPEAAPEHPVCPISGRHLCWIEFPGCCVEPQACERDQQCGAGMCCAVSLWIRSLRMCTPMGNLGDDCHPLSHRVSTSPGGFGAGGVS